MKKKKTDLTMVSKENTEYFYWDNEETEQSPNIMSDLLKTSDKLHNKILNTSYRYILVRNKKIFHI